MAPSPNSNPNIVLIMCDDLGYGDLGCYGNQVIRTPHIDALAASGLRFSSAYASAAWCMPSRKGLMTGNHPYRDGIDNWQQLLETTTMAAMLRKRGYTTALVGKWHLRMDEGFHPLDRGFDYFYGTAGSNDPITVDGQAQIYRTFRDKRREEDWPVELLQNRGCIEYPARQSLFTQRYTREALRFIRDSSRQSRPFFLYLAHNMPHVPIFASPEFLGESKGGLYGDVVEELDWSVGEVRQFVRDQGLQENTIFIFTSDNGPWSMFGEYGGSAGPLRGEKGTGWEGGHRVPFIVSWPGKVRQATTPAFVVHVDLYRTFAGIAGCDVADCSGIDSIDISDVLIHGAPSPRSEYLFFSGARYREPFSYRHDVYKYHIRTNPRSRNPETGEDQPIEIHDPALVFDLDADMGETVDILGRDSGLTARLASGFHRVSGELGWNAK